MGAVQRVSVSERVCVGDFGVGRSLVHMCIGVCLGMFARSRTHTTINCVVVVVLPPLKETLLALYSLIISTVSLLSCVCVS